MLRHIRMTCRTGTELLPSRLSQILREWVRPLYAFTVQHRTLGPGEADPICRCRYPLYTLCYPYPSPYDMLPSNSGNLPLTSSEFALSSDAPMDTTAVPPVEKSPFAGVKSRTVGDDSQTHEWLADATESTPSFLTTKVRRRQALHMRKIWSRRMPPLVAHPNIIPNRPTCYRCDICDGFLDAKGHHEADGSKADSEPVARGGSEDLQGTQLCSEARSSATNSFVSAVPSIVPKEATTRILPNRSFLKVSLAKATDTNEVATRGSLLEGHEVINGEHSTRAVSTDIANTIMNDTEVAELRYLDPFLVEVLGSPSVVSLSRYFIRELQAQLKRSSLTYNYLTKSIKNAVGISRSHEMVYKAWTQQKQHTSRPFSQGQNISEGALGRLQTQVDLFDLAAYTVRFAVAAYGLPYELGYFNSPNDISKLHARPHCRYTCATSDEQIESMRRMLHEEEVDHHMEFAMSRYSTRIGHPCYAVVLDHSKRRVVLTFRGPLTLSDVVTCITDGYRQVNLAQPDALGGVSAESGRTASCSQSANLTAPEWRRFSKASGQNRSGLSLEVTEDQLKGESLVTRIPLGFYRAVREAAHSVVPELSVIHTYYPNYQLIITGHSLGGAIAVLFYLLYCFRPKGALAPRAVSFENVQTVAFGAPPLLEKKILRTLNFQLDCDRERGGSRIINFCYGKDLVSRLQPRSVRQILTEQHSSSSDQSTMFEHVTDTKHISRKNINRNCDIPDWILPTLAVPGEFLNISDTQDHNCFEVGEDDTWCSQLILFPEAVFHHHPNHYMRGLNHLLTCYSMQLAEAKDRFEKNSNIV
ncbi:unnamed protein product [Phytomonas sp. EM1]|nr:unnamed protein product [Phytomonas sp. EM1]|eukprot:CCW60309.1 unnamed protein product [Phytomonas sp. isolate EM1]